MSSNKNCVSKKLAISLVVISILVVLFIGGVLFIFINNEKNKGEEFFDSGSIVMTYSENSEIFFINNMVAVSDEVGKSSNDESKYFDFTIKVNLGDSKLANYEIALSVNEDFSTVLPSDIMVYLEKQESGSYVPVSDPISLDKLDLKSDYGAKVGDKILTKVSSNETVSHNYRLRMWLRDGSEVMPDVIQSFGIEINVYGETK